MGQCMLPHIALFVKKNVWCICSLRFVNVNNIIRFTSKCAQIFILNVVDAYLGRKSSVANFAFEWTFFSMGSNVNL